MSRLRHRSTLIGIHAATRHLIQLPRRLAARRVGVLERETAMIELLQHLRGRQRDVACRLGRPVERAVALRIVLHRSGGRFDAHRRLQSPGLWTGWIHWIHRIPDCYCSDAARSHPPPELRKCDAVPTAATRRCGTVSYRVTSRDLATARYSHASGAYKPLGPAWRQYAARGRYAAHGGPDRAIAVRAATERHGSRIHRA